MKFNGIDITQCRCIICQLQLTGFHAQAFRYDSRFNVNYYVIFYVIFTYYHVLFYVNYLFYYGDY